MRNTSKRKDETGRTVETGKMGDPDLPQGEEAQLIYTTMSVL